MVNGKTDDRQNDKPDRQQQQPQTEHKASLREAALRKALREVAPDAGAASEALAHARSHDRERRRWMSREQKDERAEFLRAITATATLLWQARDINGEPIHPTDARYQVLAALERIGGWPSISELARALRVSKQAAREHVVGAARAGLLELLPDPHDRRSIQVGLTAEGKRSLAGVHARQFLFGAHLLNGLEPRDMRLASHVLRVIRGRLQASRGPILAPHNR
jgi:DNA-binding MarR family transcriptional regulator